MKLGLNFLAAALAAAASVSGLVLPATSPANGNPTVAPDQDPFYVPPSNLSSYQNGQIIWSRPVAPAAIQDPGVGSVAQVLYRTTNTQNESSATVATVFTPSKPSGDPSILSLQFYEDSASGNCAPSWSLINGLSTPNWPTSSLDMPIITKWALNLGYYVVIADHEGPNSGFIAGFEEGQAGLDGIRAALVSASLPGNTKVALYGYSGGGHATAWMSNLVPTYAPELNVVGSAHGGTPIDLSSMVKFLEHSFFAGFVADGLAGVLNVYPDYNDLIVQKCNQFVQDAITFMRTQGNCLIQAVTTYNFASFTDKCDFGPGVDFFHYPPAATIMAAESLLYNISSRGVNVPTFPRLMWHSRADEIVPFAPAQQYVNEQCEHGANIQFAALDFGEHITGEIVGVPGGLQFIQQAFAGTTPRVACGTATNFLTLDSLNVDSVIGTPTANSLRQINATTVYNPFRGPDGN